jgi:hypothetical protein
MTGVPFFAVYPPLSMNLRFTDPSGYFSKYSISGFFVGWVTYFDSAPYNLTMANEDYIIDLPDRGSGPFNSTRRSLLRDNNSTFEVRATDSCAVRGFTLQSECNTLVAPIIYHMWYVGIQTIEFALYL